MGERNLNTIFLKPVDSGEVINLVSLLKCSKACGPNSIPNKIIKNNIQALVGPLEYILNISLEQGNFPNLLKKAEVCPIYKKKMINTNVKIIDPYHYSQILVSFLKEQYIIVYMILLKVLMYCMTCSSALGSNTLQIMRY